MSVSQAGFRAALTGGGPVPRGLGDGQGAGAGRRFDVYRNNVAASLVAALRTGFPTIARLLGDANFATVEGAFLRAHPPTSPVMMHYGESFPEFLATHPRLTHLGYLSDCARLDLAVRRVYHAADAEPCAADRMAAVPPEALGAARIRLVPAAALLRSSWPIHAIRLFNLDPDAPKPRPGGQDVLVTRPAYDPKVRLLPRGAGAFLAALIAGRTVADAHDAATSQTGDFDLTALLSILIADGAIAELEV